MKIESVYAGPAYEMCSDARIAMLKKDLQEQRKVAQAAVERRDWNFEEIIRDRIRGIEAELNECDRICRSGK